MTKLGPVTINQNLRRTADAALDKTFSSAFDSTDAKAKAEADLNARIEKIGNLDALRHKLKGIALSPDEEKEAQTEINAIFREFPTLNIVAFERLMTDRDLPLGIFGALLPRDTGTNDRAYDKDQFNELVKWIVRNTHPDVQTPDKSRSKLDNPNWLSSSVDDTAQKSPEIYLNSMAIKPSSSYKDAAQPSKQAPDDVIKPSGPMQGATPISSSGMMQSSGNPLPLSGQMQAASGPPQLSGGPLPPDAGLKPAPISDDALRHALETCGQTYESILEIVKDNGGKYAPPPLPQAMQDLFDAANHGNMDAQAKSMELIARQIFGSLQDDAASATGLAAAFYRWLKAHPQQPNP
jgi:hypothetical protein